MIFSTVAGSGSPVVLLHSGVCDSRMWDPLWPGLTQHHRVLRCDLRGFGRTPAPAGRYRDADDVAEVITAAGIGSAAVVGSSFGGRVALELAACHPEKVTRLVLVCPAFPLGESTPAMAAFEEAEDALIEAGDLDAATELNVRTWVGPAADPTTRALVAHMQREAFALQAAAPDDSHRQVPDVNLTAITVRVLVLSGGHDLDQFQLIAEHLAATLPNAEHRGLDWAGHLPSLERPQEFALHLDRFLDRVIDRS